MKRRNGLFFQEWEATQKVAFLLSLPAIFGIVTMSAFSQPVGKNEWKTVRLPNATLEYHERDSAQAKRVSAYVNKGVETIIKFFGRPFPKPFTVRIYPDRASIDAYWSADWGVPGFKSECWMVANGSSATLTLLSPAVWKTQACEHNADDERHVQDLLTHELAHVYHGQMNPRPNFDGMDDVGWFVEGLAVFASGQLEREHRDRAREAITKGKTPLALKQAWSGAYRYGVCGSIIEYIDKMYGRKTLTSMLSKTSESELLAELRLTEAQLLERWKTFAAGTK